MDYNKEKAAELAEKAKEKLEKERKDVTGQKATAMADAVMAALISFAGQDAEFADAIVTNSQTLANCMAAVAKGVGSSISDLDAYKRAVQFYFPGAEIEMQMTVHVNPHDMPADPAEAAVGKVTVLSLEDIL